MHQDKITEVQVRTYQGAKTLWETNRNSRRNETTYTRLRMAVGRLAHIEVEFKLTSPKYLQFQLKVFETKLGMLFINHTPREK